MTIEMSKWNQCIDLAGEFKARLREFTREESHNLNHSNMRVFFLVLLTIPVLCDLRHSLREKDWSLHLSTVQRGIPLFFSFDRTNYSMLYQKYMEGDLFLQQSPRASGAVPMDQALE